MDCAPFRGALLNPVDFGGSSSDLHTRSVKRFNGSKSKARTKRPFRFMVFFVPFPVQAYPERGKMSAVTKGFPSSVAKIGIYLVIANFKYTILHIFVKKSYKLLIINQL